MKEVSHLKNDLSVKLLVFDIIAQEMKLKFATRFDVPFNAKHHIFKSYDSSIEILIKVLVDEFHISIQDSPRLAKQIIEYFKEEVLKTTGE